jgi:hypothetical protein
MLLRDEHEWNSYTERGMLPVLLHWLGRDRQPNTLPIVPQEFVCIQLEKGGLLPRPCDR